MVSCYSLRCTQASLCFCTNPGWGGNRHPGSWCSRSNLSHQWSAAGVSTSTAVVYSSSTILQTIDVTKADIPIHLNYYYAWLPDWFLRLSPSKGSQWKRVISRNSTAVLWDGNFFDAAITMDPIWLSVKPLRRSQVEFRQVKLNCT